MQKVLRSCLLGLLLSGVSAQAAFNFSTWMTFGVIGYQADNKGAFNGIKKCGTKTIECIQEYGPKAVEAIKVYGPKVFDFGGTCLHGIWLITRGASWDYTFGPALKNPLLAAGLSSMVYGGKVVVDELRKDAPTKKNFSEPTTRSSAAITLGGIGFVLGGFMISTYGNVLGGFDWLKKQVKSKQS